MTEAELIQTAQEAWSNVINILALLITVISAYLVVAYVVGKDLTKSQVALINVLYGAFAGFGIFAVHRFSLAANEMGKLALEMSTQRTLGPSDAVPLGFLVVLIPILVGCYKFMWDIRHPKPD